ncbi:hypothetical protein [Brevibacillus sp. NRS-1366]|uniref:hypothetical protein n=1 Tax=Brevibacillus sp. NRS-1366 TaxID=3233899 RepID=UPI003D25159C
MDLSNISKGQIVKNYKEMCNLLYEPVLAGNSKKAQLKEWERYFSFYKDGNKFVIVDVYTEPLQRQDERNSNGGVRKLLPHAVRMDRILMYQLNLIENKGEIFLPISSLLKEMNMINQNYNFGKRHIKKVSKYLKIEEATVEEFFDYSRRTFKNNIESMLDRLRNKSLIFWSKIITVCIANIHISQNELGQLKAKVNKVVDQYDNETLKVSAEERTSISFRAANKEEIELILKVEGEVLDELKCISKQEVVQKRKWKEFINTVNDTLTKRANILYYYDSYKIIKNEERLSREVANNLEGWIKDEIEYAIEMICLNNDVQGQIISNTIKRSEKAIQELVNGVYNQYTKMRTSDKYLEDNMSLIDTFIGMQHKNIIDDIKRNKHKNNKVEHN